MKEVLIHPNLSKKEIVQAIRQTCDVLNQREIGVLLSHEVAVLNEDFGNVKFLTLEQGIQRADAMVVLGGDGTILRIAGLAAQYATPILGVNLGHVGFMTELERGEIDLVAQLHTGEYQIDNRMMLCVQVLRENQCVYQATALNEIMVSKSYPFHIIQMQLYSDCEMVTEFKGDGIILATPTGTTAYSHSAGGPIIEPTAENIAVTPVCPFTIGAKPLVFSSQRRLIVKAKGADGGSVCVSADGGTGFEMQPQDRVLVYRAPYPARLIRVKNRNFYQILRHKLSDGGDRQ